MSRYANNDFDHMTAKDSGFSLLETMVALAILSIASLALFQSTGSMLRMSDRTVKVGESIIDRALTRRHLEALVNQLVPSWEHGEEPAFMGDEEQFSGISRMAFNADQVGFSHFLIRLEPDSNSQLTLSLQLDDDVSSLQFGVSNGARFNYLTPTNKWIAIWPPNIQEEKFGEKDFLAQYNLKLPEAIRLIDSNRDIIWVIPVPDAQNVPDTIDFETF